LTSSTGSVREESTVWVAPSSAALASFLASMSTMPSSVT